MSYVATLVALVFLAFASFTTRVAFSAAKGQLPSAAEPKNPEAAQWKEPGKAESKLDSEAESGLSNAHGSIPRSETEPELSGTTQPKPPRATELDPGASTRRQLQAGAQADAWARREQLAQRGQLAQRSRRAFPLIAVLAVIAWAHGLALLTMGVRGFAGTAPGPMPVWVVIGSGIFTCVGVSLVVLRFLKKAAD
ncbi:hypothetical protein QS713_04005 [Gleimia hominis]|uniref:Uncharacterized protein n=1 Tax=Gleimia hominis TaxID=595468 RepID=A0ABU3IA34_9ACTO|nr:hypothetical protein [Gleimia hominis]MDT3767231.1 hypothetical protein [Gleimia hominis]